MRGRLCLRTVYRAEPQRHFNFEIVVPLRVATHVRTENRSKCRSRPSCQCIIPPPMRGKRAWVESCTCEEAAKEGKNFQTYAKSRHQREKPG
eukprot:IDg8461t1